MWRMHNVSMNNMLLAYVTDRHRCTCMKLTCVFQSPLPPPPPHKPLPAYQTVKVCVQVMAREAESSLSGQQRSNFKMVLVNNKPMHSWYNWLTAAGISEDQVEVRAMLHNGAHCVVPLLNSCVSLYNSN